VEVPRAGCACDLDFDLYRGEAGKAKACCSGIACGENLKLRLAAAEIQSRYGSNSVFRVS
jgi:hypothetical protein